MAGGGKEIEIKIQVPEKEWLKAMEKAEREFEFVSEKSNIDTYFNHPSVDWMAVGHPYIWFSVRRRGKNILSYKHYFPENSPEKLYCDEIEVEISEPEKMEEVLRRLGFKELVRVDKKRRKYRKGKYEIVFDKVKDLGHFIEVELIGEGEPEEERKKIMEFIGDGLGIGNFSIPDVGYPHLLMRKKGIIDR